ncbi:MAG TPA: hypothetical protein PKI19_10545 [Elusimicrobiales bacterium]|nr:hypothetical protein [Elusimicrobiales bacterium]
MKRTTCLYFLLLAAMCTSANAFNLNTLTAADIKTLDSTNLPLPHPVSYAEKAQTKANPAEINLAVKYDNFVSPHGKLTATDPKAGINITISQIPSNMEEPDDYYPLQAGYNGVGCLEEIHKWFEKPMRHYLLKGNNGLSLSMQGHDDNYTMNGTFNQANGSSQYFYLKLDRQADMSFSLTGEGVNLNVRGYVVKGFIDQEKFDNRTAVTILSLMILASYSYD